MRMPNADNIFFRMNDLAAYGEYSEPQPQDSSGQIPASKAEIANLLSGELSPELLQHASNPIAWQTWSPEAFNSARQLDIPVFLSIGYSSEHWCHVMNKECFSDIEVARLMNNAFIPVKLDREERPDLANLFMEVCKIQNGSAGWPLNIFLTPEAIPFFCTTWLPKRTTGQMPGITDILPRVKWLWHMQRRDVERTAEELNEMVREKFSALAGRHGGRIGKVKAFEALNDIRKIFDIKWGGFGPAPKFPEPVKLLFLLKLAEENSGASKRDQADALTMVDITLRRMWRGGIHDHLGGGFSHYAVDERWLVPHFEKLLCDQAMLLLTAAKAQELQGNSFHRLMAEDIIFCITKYFTEDASFSQGFRSSVDGDTPEGEGRYYAWTENEIKKILPESDTGLFCAAYGVLPSGNYAHELTGSQMGYNILYEASNVTELAKRYGLKGSDVGTRLYECRKLLLDARDARYPLRSDNKVLMSWNGLIIGALARASVAFDVSEWRDMAERSALFIQKAFVDKTGTWRRRWINGQLGIEAICEDYAYFLWGIIELYKAAKHFNAGERQLNDWLKLAQNLADVMLEKFFDEKNGGLYLMIEAPNVFIRMKSAEDMSLLPSANSLASIALNELAVILEEKKYSDYARKIINNFSHYVHDNPLSSLTMIIADLMYKPVKKKPEPKPAPVPTDEELNREEPVLEAPEAPVPETVRQPRASRRNARTEASSSRERRSARSNRRSRS